MCLPLTDLYLPPSFFHPPLIRQPEANSQFTHTHTLLAFHSDGVVAAGHCVSLCVCVRTCVRVCFVTTLTRHGCMSEGGSEEITGWTLLIDDQRACAWSCVSCGNNDKTHELVVTWAQRHVFIETHTYLRYFCLFAVNMLHMNKSNTIMCVSSGQVRPFFWYSSLRWFSNDVLR